MRTIKNPKIIVTTIPLRSSPDHYIPVGSLSVITFLRRAGFTHSYLYNIDWFRPNFNEVIEYLKREKPDILGISAVVSGSYEYLKRLSLEVKKILPQTTIISGGPMGASAEIILKKTGVDFICIGEGERTAVNFVKCLQTATTKSDFANIKGLAFLDENESMVVTPYENPIEDRDIYDINWPLMRETGTVDFWFKNFSDEMISAIPPGHRLNEFRRQGKKAIVLIASKGCVARCSFCVRWEKGIRYIPVPVLMERIDYVMREYNVGFVSFGDENFGTNKRWLTEFVTAIKKRDVLWRVAGMRVNCISSEWIEKMKDAGCVQIITGMESGSQKMLDIMEKKTTAEQNLNTLKWLGEHDVNTRLQLIIGMPGETPETIEETAALTEYFAECSPRNNPNGININFAQGYPGTPLYETIRRKGFIGSTLEDEEKHLLAISHRNASDGEEYINLTAYPHLMLENWYISMCNRTRMAYINKWGLDKYIGINFSSERFKNLKEAKAFFKKNDLKGNADPEKSRVNTNIKNIPSIWSLWRQNMLSSVSSFYPQFFWRMRYFSLVFALLNSVRKYGILLGINILGEFVIWKIKRLFFANETEETIKYISLRKLVDNNFFPKIPADNLAMESLRKGR